MSAIDRFSFELLAQHGPARAGMITTPHGEVPTPIFMPVGTLASVKGLDSGDVEETGAAIQLANTYHLYLRPGTETLESQGGVHQFMQWRKPVLTDSGGFQVFSLGAQAAQKGQSSAAKITDQGVEFKSHYDGSSHFFSPESAIEIQRQIGADIIMAFDECTPDQAEEAYVRQALDRTHRWAQQCVDTWEKHQRRSVYGNYQALFGIIQGAMNQEMRIESSKIITQMDFDGIAVGGETVGYNMAGTVQVMDWIKDILPPDKPRYAMGLGRDPQNILDAVLAGFDMFDCVAPSRLARNGALYAGQIEWGSSISDIKFVSSYKQGRLQIGNARFKQDNQPIQLDCDCTTCSQGYSRAYLHHLYKTQELSYYRLATIHNIRFMIRLTEQLRSYIMSQ